MPDYLLVVLGLTKCFATGIDFPEGGIHWAG